jgi:hypothetical protein
MTAEHLAAIYDRRKALAGEAAGTVEAAIYERLDADRVLRDLFDIFVYDRARKKAADGK